MKELFENPMQISLSGIECGTVLAGAERLGKDEGTYETYKGLVDVPSGMNRAYIKVLPHRGLVNELVAFVLAKALDMPVLDGYLLRVRSRDIPASRILASIPDEEQLVFGSQALERPTLLRRMNYSWQSANKFLSDNKFKGWEDVAIFDDWITNGDRHPGNLLISEKDRAWCIDHSESFTGIAWQKPNLVADRYHPNYLAKQIASNLNRQEKDDLIDKVRGMMLTIQVLPLDDATKASYASTFLSIEDDEALTTFIVERIDHLPNIMRRRLGGPIQQTLF